MTREELKLSILDRENAELRERVAYLERCLCEPDARYDLLGLTASEARVFGSLVKRTMLSKEQIGAVLYADRKDRELPDLKIVDVYVCKIRAKLERFGIRIETVWGHGYEVRPEMKTLVFQVLGQFSRSAKEIAA